jgi:hypothetical protein
VLDQRGCVYDRTFVLQKKEICNQIIIPLKKVTEVSFNCTYYLPILFSLPLKPPKTGIESNHLYHEKTLF